VCSSATVFVYHTPFRGQRELSVGSEEVSRVGRDVPECLCAGLMNVFLACVQGKSGVGFRGCEPE
jgi:hypothetical protein